MNRDVLGHSLVRSLVRSHGSLIRLLRTARFASALCCTHSLARSLAHFAHFLACGNVIDGMAMYFVFFFLFCPSVACGERELEHFDLSQFPKTRVQLFHFTVAEGRLKNSRDLFSISMMMTMMMMVMTTTLFPLFHYITESSPIHSQ